MFWITVKCICYHGLWSVSQRYEIIVLRGMHFKFHRVFLKIAPTVVSPVHVFPAPVDEIFMQSIGVSWVRLIEAWSRWRTFQILIVYLRRKLSMLTHWVWSKRKKKTDLMSYLNYIDSFHIVILSCQDGRKRRVEIWG